MRDSINNFRQGSGKLDQVSDLVHVSWRDSIAENFYRDIVTPMKEESTAIAMAMDDLASTLEMIKEKIDSI